MPSYILRIQKNAPWPIAADAYTMPRRTAVALCRTALHKLWPGLPRNAPIRVKVTKRAHPSAIHVTYIRPIPTDFNHGYAPRSINITLPTGKTTRRLLYPGAGELLDQLGVPCWVSVMPIAEGIKP